MSSMAGMKREYQPLKVTDHGLAAMDNIRKMYSDLHEQLEKTAPPSRARSIALTQLEQSSHFAIRAIAEAHEIES